MLRKYDVTVWAGFIWHRLGTSGGISSFGYVSVHINNFKAIQLLRQKIV
jgi:hypothetical protein